MTTGNGDAGANTRDKAMPDAVGSFNRGAGKRAGAELDGGPSVRCAAVVEQRLNGIERPRPDGERTLAGSVAKVVARDGC